MTKRTRMFADYNAWANERLYGAVARLPDSDFRADRGAFFKSLHGTLNHILVGDKVWMRRFTGEGDLPSRLDATLHENLPDLWAARQSEDARIRNYVAPLDEAAMAGRIRYRTITNPASVEQELGPALDHFFNHQTHHRGQAHAILTGLGHEAPSLDLMLLHRETGYGNTVLL